MRKTKTLKEFYNYCSSCYCQTYLKEYIKNMNIDEFKMFYDAVKLAASFLIDENYLFYKMFWILKHPYDNLCKELLYELIDNVEGYNLSKIITKEKFNKLLSLYSTSCKEHS